ncbi:MAG: DNA-binding response regulator [Myxococcales bacterium]|nr:DNA-binding response regulator [Myxococcales bacterium]
MAHILLVEDDADVVTYARVLLESHSHTVEVAGDGEAAMVAYMTRRPDVILLDVFVPRIDGLRFALKVRETFPLDRTPVVVWTGAYEPESIGDLLDTPHVLHKPAASEELLEVVRRALGDETKSRALRVLVVSESPAALRGIVGELRADFDVHTASRWDEALALIDVRPYEAVVVDVATGEDNDERDGVGILRAVHARYRDMARVALIAYEQENLGHDLATSGAAEVVMKRPWPDGALSEKLHAIVG